MSETTTALPELTDILTLIARHTRNEPLRHFLLRWENIIYAAFAALFIIVVFWIAGRKKALIPQKLQNFAELVIGSFDDFVAGILGEKGRKFTPFIGTLFLYILTMNLMGLIPFLKSPTSDWSTTLALALCVFVYVQYTAFREFGFLGFFDHLMGKPRGAMAFTLVFPVFFLCLHLISELVRPITLSLRLRSNIWGDDLLIAILSRFGLMGLPLILFSTFLALIAAIVQAVVFCLLTTVYFALIVQHEGDEKKEALHGL
ncbi:MAG: F0F1 ATP synthase subunit A [Candidatus Omnitrophota bacterium]|nr:F0F1 ATP synthase subunit A [Candidatus Omnitrophota bacterium]